MKSDTQEYLWVLVPLNLLGLSKLLIFCMFIIWFVGMVTYMHTDFQSHNIVYINYMQFSVCALHSVAQFSSVQSLSRVRLFATPWIAAHQASLSITNSRSSLKLMSIRSVMPSSHLILCRPLLLLPPIPPSIKVFSNESNLRVRWPKYRSFSFSISPSNEHPGLISFRMDWLDLLAVQGILKSLLQHHSSKASILWCSAFFAVQLSHPYMTTGCSGVGEGQGNLVCCSPWGCKVWHDWATELNWDYIMRNAGLEEEQAGIKIAGRNINNLRYADDTTLMAESEGELKSLLMKVKEESEKVGLRLNI